MSIINSENNTFSSFEVDDIELRFENSDITLNNSVNRGFISSNNSIIEIYSSDINTLSGMEKTLMDFSGNGTVLIKESSFTPKQKLIRRSSGVTVLKE